MSSVGPALIAMVVLAAAGVIPAVVLAGPQWPAVPLAVLSGAVIAAGAVAGCVAIGGPLGFWFAALAVAAAALAGNQVRLRRHRGHDPVPLPPRTVGGVTVTVIAAVGVVVALAWSLRGLRAPTVGFDARAIWLLHAHWFASGHIAARAGIQNPNLALTHASYPPLLSGTVAVAWIVTGDQSYRLGVIVVALLNASALAVAAWAMVEAGRRLGAGPLQGASVGEARSAGGSADPETAAATRRSVHHWTRRSRAPFNRWGIVPVIVGIVVACLAIQVTLGIAGVFATNGYADLLWSAAAVAGISWGLVLGDRPGDIGIAGVVIAVAGLTKVEGIATAAAITLLVALRLAWSRRGHGHDLTRWRPAANTIWKGFGGVALLAFWPLLMKVENASADSNTTGSREGSETSRARATWDSMAPHLHVLELAVPLVFVCWLCLRPLRRRAGLGNDLWAWAGVGAGLAFIAGAYITGPGSVAFWLYTSVHRTTIFPAVGAWWLLGLWVVTAAAAPMLSGGPGPPLENSVPPTSSSDRPVDLNDTPAMAPMKPTPVDTVTS